MATGSNNFKVFNESMDADRTLNDSDYSQSTQRQSGVIPGVAQSKLHNKLYRQVSVMAKAIANLISDKGYDCVDTDIEGITFNLEKAIKAMAGDSIEKHNDDYSSHSVALNFWQKSKVYALGDIIYPKVHGTSFYFECIQAGTSGTTEPSWTYTEGNITTDGGAKWQVKRKGGGSGKALGDMYHSMCVDPPEGSVRFDGTEYTQALFPDFYKQLADGKISSLTYAQWQTQYAANGNVGLCALDTVNKKFKVGLIDSSTFIGQAIIGQLGSFVAAGIPNIKAKTDFQSRNASGVNIVAMGPQITSGAFFASGTTTSGNAAQAGAAGNNNLELNLDASRSSNVYRDDVTTVIPRHIRYPIYLVVANASVPASQAQYDAFMGALSNKANTDFSNTSLGNVNNIQAGLYTTITVGIQKWAIEYFTDATKTNRVWCRQGGFNKSTGVGVATINASFLVPFLNIDSIIANRTNISSYGGAIANQDAWHGFIAVTTSGLSFKTDLTNQPRVFWLVEGV